MLASHRSHAGADATRAKILAAAREIFESNGTRGTTTREVAIRAGVNEATLFRHFGSKAALIAAMREEACGVERYRNAIATMTGEDIAADLRALGRIALDRMNDQRRLMMIAMAEDAVSGDEDPLGPEWRGPRQIRDLLAEYLSARVAEGRLRGDAATLARVMMGMMLQSVVARKLWADAPSDSHTVDLLVDIFLNGVRT